MSNQLAPWVKAIEAAQPRFEAILAESKATALIWAKELGYARGILETNTALQMCSPGSIRDAIVNVAAIGLTLHPDEKLAYLVPRDGRATLNVSYVGMVRLATTSGAIEFVRAGIVHENDTFEFRGLDDRPEHHYNPFAKAVDRGPIKGVYCYAKLPTGAYLADAMSVEEIEVVRNTSKAPNSPAWKKWYGEMAKKAVIKRASKLWPRPAQERLAPAIRVLNEADGLADEHKAGDTAREHYAEPRRKSESPRPPKPETAEPATDEGNGLPVIDVEYMEVVEPSSANDAPPLTDGARRLITRKLSAANLGENDLFKAFEVGDWGDLPQNAANAILEWIAGEAS